MKTDYEDIVGPETRDLIRRQRDAIPPAMNTLGTGGEGNRTRRQSRRGHDSRPASFDPTIRQLPNNSMRVSE